MRRKGALIVAILLLSIGFAAVSTTLIINGKAKVNENQDDFSVIFTAASLDNVDVYDEVTDDTKKTITFKSKDLMKLNDTSVLDYEVTNNSSNYDAEVKINCNTKENTTAKYTSIKNELENNVTVVKAKESVNGTLTITLNQTSTEEVTEEYTCTLEFTAVERTELEESIPAFQKDSWSTIASNVKKGNIKKYNIGDTREVDLGSLGTHTVRLSNKSECTTETSETACGFVVEFVDIIKHQKYNSANTNAGGWRSSELRVYVNGTLYNLLPSDLQDVIISTKVISGHGNTSGETNFETQDKLYLLSTKEVYGRNWYDTVNTETKQLDYYKNLGVTLSDYSGAIKQYSGKNSVWWLRSAYTSNPNAFVYIINDGNGGSNLAINAFGISPAFRIG